MEHASDTALAAVRTLALDVVSLILHDSASRLVLQSLLPKFGILIHEFVEKIRAACIRMSLQN
jgi:hypothetical protein